MIDLVALLTGPKLGRYEIRSQLGAGGIGEVYLARDTEGDLEKAYRELSFGESVIDLKESPFWDPIRSDPRFADLLRRMNLTSEVVR